MEAKENAHVRPHAGASVSNGTNSFPSDSHSRHTTILPEELDNLLSTTTAERALPPVALELHPELRGTVWHRVGFRTACTALAHALLGTEGDKRISAFAHLLAQVITAEGKATVLDGKVLVTGDGKATAFGDRALYVMRCDR